MANCLEPGSKEKWAQGLRASFNNMCIWNTWGYFS